MTTLRRSSRLMALLVPLIAIAAFTHYAAPTYARGKVAPAKPKLSQILQGRYLVLSHDCQGCHGGITPDDPHWLAGAYTPIQEFKIGACAVTAGAQPCWTTRPRNLTPDNTTGLGRFSERQIFNALRYGLRPGETPDVTITSTTPGKGNFPANPRYLAPPMPWPGWRYMHDEDLWAIAAYLKYGVKPVSHHVDDSEGPPDFWASVYAPAEIGPYPMIPFPGTNERKN